MLTEQQLINNEVNANDDLEGVDSLIQNLYDEIMKKRFKVVQLRRGKKTEEADQLDETVCELQKELDGIIKSQMQYVRYLKSVNSGKPTMGAVSMDLKRQKSSNGDIVQLIPKE